MTHLPTVETDFILKTTFLVAATYCPLAWRWIGNDSVSSKKQIDLRCVVATSFAKKVVGA